MRGIEHLTQLIFTPLYVMTISTHLNPDALIQYLYSKKNIMITTRLIIMAAFALKFLEAAPNLTHSFRATLLPMILNL